jgi:hypothetical protein
LVHLSLSILIDFVFEAVEPSYGVLKPLQLAGH